ncbi:TonB-dependent receptor [Bifidobacterium tsurumiense]|uniref:TonB-dependent receptor n=1 Tax=Bifidobacterium tsurumiense TaxID=356829 RepID=A0A087EES8_9BIFI|nr:TonB-dependent receptor [Bifidobacterium tsurumiense]
MMIRKDRSLGIQCLDVVHIVFAELKVEDVEVLTYSLRICRLRKGHNPALKLPAEHDLRHGLAVLLGDINQNWIAEDIVVALCKGSPALGHDSLGCLVCLLFLFLMEHVELDLVHRRDDIIENRKVCDLIFFEIGDTNRADLPCLVQLFQGSPCPEGIPYRLVKQIQIDVIQTELSQ